MKPLLVSTQESSGGAARASRRLFQLLLDNGVDASLFCSNKSSSDPNVYGIKGFQKLVQIARIWTASKLLKLQSANDGQSRSVGFGPSTARRFLSEVDCDVVNLHWINGEFLTLKDIGKHNKPIVWTFHDMWPLCGTEHYCADLETARWVHGYSKANKPNTIRGIDVDRWNWERKVKSWRRPFQIVTPSNWLADCVRISKLFRDFPVTCIPNPLDLNIFRPWPKNIARKAFGIPEDVPLILFGAINSDVSGRKGLDLLLKALPIVGSLVPDARLAIFGGSKFPLNNLRDSKLPIHRLGSLSDDLVIAMVYSMADVMVVPSRLDNLPQTATEAQACGCPVVAFNTGGLSDAVGHTVSGYLAQPFSVEELADGIRFCLKYQNEMAAASRDRALRIWDRKRIFEKYSTIYKQVLKN